MVGLVALQPHEVAPLRTTMRDLQMAVSRYYAETGHFGDDDEAAAQVRAFLTSAQQMNDSLSAALADSATYKALVDGPSPHPARGVIRGMKYARNVSEHVLHIVKQSAPQSMVGNSDMGFHTYSEWEEIPTSAHAKLRAGTQKLKPDYDAHFRGQEVLGVMFEVLRFYAEVVPDAMHRDARGEWTGFPLQFQPAMSTLLHPEEPSDLTDARAWLDARRPNGDLRMVAGQLAHDGVQYVVGFTFTGQLSFGPFVESLPQVEADIAQGFTYVKWDGEPKLQDASAEFPRYRTGIPYRAVAPLTEWTTAFDPSVPSTDWSVGYARDAWLQTIRIERGAGLPDALTYHQRKARRLNAFYVAR